MIYCYKLAPQVVFRSGEGALQVLPPLIDVIPEARLNLVIYYLRQGMILDQASVHWAAGGTLGLVKSPLGGVEFVCSFQRHYGTFFSRYPQEWT